MKKLGKLKLKDNFQILNHQEMKMVLGGSSIHGLDCGDRGIEYCFCKTILGNWYQCEGANTGSWACNASGYYCEPY